MFRKGKALGEQGFFDKALSLLEDLKKRNPTGDYIYMFAPIISN
jgi:pentatricopeptide repeat protein